MYNSVQCPKCGKFQVTTSIKLLKCKYCNKSTALVSAKGCMRANLKSFSTARKAAVHTKLANTK